MLVVLVVPMVAVLVLVLVVEVNNGDWPKSPLTLSLKLFDPKPLATALPTGQDTKHRTTGTPTIRPAHWSHHIEAAEKKVLSSHMELGRHPRDQEGLCTGSWGEI